MSAGCPFITCALKRKGVSFCWDCEEGDGCARWARHRALGREGDSFTSYAALESNIALAERDGIAAFLEEQRLRERLLGEMLAEFNEGRSKSYYCIAATVLTPAELREALDSARSSAETDVRERSRALHARLDAAAEKRGVMIALRKR